MRFAVKRSALPSLKKEDPMRTPVKRLLLAAALIALLIPSVASAAQALEGPSTVLLASGLEGGSGSTVGPDGALYATEGFAGEVSRVDPRTGEITTYASGLPKSIVGIGGAMDVVFIGNTAYVLVTLVGPDVGGTDVVGIYRIDGPESFTVIADIGAFSLANPPNTDFFVPTGVQYAIEVFQHSLLVTDGHHNRVLRVTLDGTVSELIAFGNIVPTGLEIRGSTVYMSQAGPAPHLPETGKVVSFRPQSPTVTEVASGARLAVDVEFAQSRDLYVLSQGVFLEGDPEGAPAQPNTGTLYNVDRDGTLTLVVDGLNQPTSLEFIRNTAFVITLGGEIWRVENISSSPHG